MDTSNSLEKIMNFYSFVKTESPRTDANFVNQRLWEHNLMAKQRNAVTYCRKFLDINTTDLSKLTNSEKDSIETCLRENFLKNNPDYFGQRDTIFLDLHNYS